MSPVPEPAIPNLPSASGVRPLRIWLGLRRLADSWWGALLGGAVYGAWATWANWDQGMHTAAGIGFSHWMTSAALTLFGTAAMRRFYGPAGTAYGWLRAFVGGLALTYITLFTVHGLLGTMHLWLTLAPGLVPNVLFCGSYAALLQRTLPHRRLP
jgi:hypothetical protein